MLLALLILTAAALPALYASSAVLVLLYLRLKGVDLHVMELDIRALWERRKEPKKPLGL